MRSEDNTLGVLESVELRPFVNDPTECEREVAMESGYHHACRVTTPDGDWTVKTTSDCHLVRARGWDLTYMDGAGSTNDRSGGRECHPTNQIRDRNQTKKYQRTSLSGELSEAEGSAFNIARHCSRTMRGAF